MNSKEIAEMKIKFAEKIHQIRELRNFRIKEIYDPDVYHSSSVLSGIIRCVLEPHDFELAKNRDIRIVFFRRS